jgi:hypothetical protein
MILFLWIWNRLNITCLNRNCCFRYFSIHGTIFSPESPFSKPCPAMFLTSYSSIIIIPLKCRFVACAWSQLLPLSCACYTVVGNFQEEQFNEIFGISSSDGDICILHYNFNVGTYHLNQY